MGKTLDADVRRLLDGANFASLATLMPDGSPKVEPVWVGREEDLVLVATDARSLKGRNLAADGRVASDPEGQFKVFTGNMVKLM